LSACAVIISYWSDLNAAIWIAILCLPFLVLNMLGVKYYGESEVITASLKVITLVGYVGEESVRQSRPEN
jgi:amino acid transporter